MTSSDRSEAAVGVYFLLPLIPYRFAALPRPLPSRRGGVTALEPPLVSAWPFSVVTGTVCDRRFVRCRGLSDNPSISVTLAETGRVKKPGLDGEGGGGG